MAFKQSSFPYKFKLTEKFVAEVLEVDPEKYCKQDQGSQVAPQGCKISPCNSKISIEPNLATFAEITLVKSVKYNLKRPKNGPDMAPICS